MTETTFYIEEIDPIDDENDVETKGSDVIDLSPSPSLIDAAGQPEKVCWFQLQSKGVKPKARGGHSLTATGRGQILLFGGSTRTADFFNDTFVFDIASSSWKQLEVTGVSPPGRSGHSACFHDNKLFVFGGQKVTMAGSDMQFEFLSDLWSLDLATSTWKHVAVKGSKLPKRNGHSAHVVDNSLFIFFGSDEQGPHSDIWRVNLDTLECSRVITQGPEPEARELHGSLLTATGEGNLVIISGGRGVDGLFEDAFTFNCTSLTWSRYGDFPVRAAHAMFQAGDRFAAFGGMDPTGFCGDVLINVKHQTTAGNPKADRSNDSAMAAPAAESNDAKKKKKMTKKEKNLRAKQRNNWFRGAVESPSDDSSAASAIASLQISSSKADNAASSLKLEGLVAIGAPSARFAFGFVSLSKDQAMVWGGMNEKGDLDDFLVISVSCPQ